MDNYLAHVTTVGSGSYDIADVHCLLRQVQVDPTDVLEKERLIQSGQRHYSDMIGVELPPSETHIRLYERAMDQNGARMARDVHSLALTINGSSPPGPIVLASLVRAGLPVGALLRRALVRMGREVFHYGISIVRGRGIDMVALDAIVAKHGATNLFFVDGWTGKGAIAGELARSLADDPRLPRAPRLVVLADPCGAAWLAASSDDWVIPCGILGATVSGLISRSLWPTDGGLHGCVVYEHLTTHDVTRAFVDRISSIPVAANVAAALPWSDQEATRLQAAATHVVRSHAECHGVTNTHRIKPGIAEATRAVLRRVPEKVLVRDKHDPDVQLLIHLTERVNLEVAEVGIALGPYRALTIIRGIER